VGSPDIARFATASYYIGERERALGLLERAREQAQIEADLQCIGPHSVGRGLHELAEREGAYLSWALAGGAMSAGSSWGMTREPR
jgi:hypothetical protein